MVMDIIQAIQTLGLFPTGIIIGMGAGTGFYIPTTVFTGFISAIILLFDKFGYGQRFAITRLLKLETGADVSAADLQKLISQHYAKVNLMNETYLDLKETSTLLNGKQRHSFLSSNTA